MRIQLAYVTPRRERLKSAPAQAMVEEFVTRASRFTPIALQPFRTEQELLATTDRRPGRTTPHLILFDGRGRALSSLQFAELIRSLRDTGSQELLLAIGPADGWTAAARGQAFGLLSLGAMTLPHELALVILAEQTYRALTILAGHPYHGGHE